jgi:signal transduction histidine kinase
MSVHGLRAVAQRHQWAVDTGIAFLIAAACAIILTGETGATITRVTPLDWVWVVVLGVPLIWRRRAPVTVFWSITALLLLGGIFGAGSPGALLVPLTALHAVARYRPASRVWPAIVGTILPGVANRPDQTHTWGAFAAVATATVVTALVGNNQRTRQAYLAELEERARLLEADRDRQARLAVAEERTRIAREMHDIVAHHLAVMVALAEGAAATVPSAPGRAVEVITQVSATGREALGEMRRLVGLLRGGTARTEADERAPQPGFADIDPLVERLRAAGLTVTLVREGIPGSWGPGAGLAVYRIVQEALTNALKHAGPRAAVEVRLHYDREGAEVAVLDDGGGRVASRPEPPGRHGLSGMRERAGSYAGRLEAGPRAGPGWQVRAHLRFDQPVAA